VRNILIAGHRKEVGKLFEMLLWQPDRMFTNTHSLDKLVKQSHMTPVDLLIVDGNIDTPERCFETLATLKESAVTGDIPIVLVTDPASENEEKARLKLAADAHISEPFNPGEIKAVAEQFI